MRKSLILPLGLLAAATIAASPLTIQSGDENDPWPVGACVHVPSLHSEPICVLVDPTE